MADLLLRTSQSTIDIAVKSTLLLAYGKRITAAGGGAFANASALRAVPDKAIRSDELAYVTAAGFTFQFNRFSTAADDGVTAIKPTDGGATGRWLVTNSTVKTGYLLAVRIHLGEESYKNMMARAFAQRPSMHILFSTMRPFERSLSKGALYQCAATYKVRCIGSNLRSNAESVEGDAIIADPPGTHQMIGDVIAALAGADLSTTGVTYCDIGTQRYVESPESGRLMVEEVEVTAYYTVQQPDTGLGVIDMLGGITMQRQLLGFAYDKSNYVSAGYTVPIGAGLTKAPAAGVAVINATAVSSTPGTTTFPVNSDTYRDLHTDGTFSYTSVANGRPAPGVAYTGVVANTMRVGVTVTDGSGVIYDAMLANTLINLRGPDYIMNAQPGATSIAITPSSGTLTTGNTLKFSAVATWPDGHTLDVSTLATWVSSAPAVATVAYDGTATWVSAGTTTISCSLDGLAGGNTPVLTCS